MCAADVPATGPRSRPAVAHELPLPAASARLLDNRFQSSTARTAGPPTISMGGGNTPIATQR